MSKYDETKSKYEKSKNENEEKIKASILKAH